MSDSVIERRALKEKVFPRFRERCRSLLALDVRALVGHQYGPACLPTQVEVSEFQLLLQESQQAGVGTRQLERAYQRDENAVPPSYRLTPAVKSVCSLLVITSTYFICSVANFNHMIDINQLTHGERGRQQRNSELQPLLSQLCDSFLPALLTSRQLILYTTTTECDRRHGYTSARRRAYADSLCHQVFSDLMALTDSLNIPRVRGQAHVRIFCFVLFCFCFSCMFHYYCCSFCFFLFLRPLVVSGGPCTGKTVLVAHCAEQVSGQVWLPDYDPVVISCFCNFSFSASPKHLLSSICHQIAHRYEEQSLKHLVSILTQLPSAKHPLILILDGLDQLENNVGAQIISSIPSPLPDAVKLIVTTGCASVQLQSADRKQCAKLLESLLNSSGRKVTSGQQALVNQALTSCSLPLYVRLLHAHTSLWHSDSDVTESSLPDGVHSSVSALLDRLEQKHGSSLVARLASYVSLSRIGLSESELVDLLSCDHDSAAEREGPISQVDVERLLMDLKNFLIKRPVADSQVLFWVSWHFKLVVTKRYLGTHGSRRKIHSEMVDYFSGRRVGRNEKPFVVSLASDPEHEQVSQPFIFPVAEDVCWVNMRKILELPHHLQQSGRLEELELELLMSLGFHQAMVQADMLSDLVAMLKAYETSTKFLRERWLIASILKSSACFLHSSPLQLPAVMETNLLPYLDVFPAFEGYVRGIRQDRKKKGKGVGLVLCPTPCSVLPICYVGPNLKTKTTRVAEIACTECDVVAEVMDDGSAWIWTGSICDFYKLSLIQDQRELKFAGVKSDCKFLLLSTQCSKLFLWDGANPESLTEVKESLKPESESSQTLSTIEGFVSCQEMICMWWKKESYVSVFDIANNTSSHFQCESSVICLAASLRSLSLYCGQEDGTLSIFDLTTSRLLGTCLNSTNSAIMQIILREEEQEIACVDRSGSVALWDVADKKQAPKLLKENFNQGKSSGILNTDYSEATSTLLVCQVHQVTLWNTFNWELWDQFLAPQGKAFSQAVLSLDGHHFLALLDCFTIILVFGVSTGECVLSLETNRQPLSLLKTASDIVCVSRDGCLTVWDSEMVNAAGKATKMRSEVKGMVVEQTGKCFYTTDGSENIWRWSLDVGFPQFTFLHAGAVEKIQLSPNNSHLLSLSAGEIYIWQTETGENIARINGGSAADVLITPSSKFGVSISKHGLSHVWKLPHGAIVCNIHQYLSDAQVSAEGTFLVGLCNGDLLAASLWSGSISKRFSCAENSEHVVAFQCLLDHPNFVVVLTASGAVYTWKLSEETVCRHFQLPRRFHCRPQDFQMLSDGNYALLSIDYNSINFLDLSRVRLCSLKAEGPVIKACLDKTGCYVVYVCNPSSQEQSCACYLHSKLVLTVVRLSDRERLGSVRLHRNPSALTVSKQQGVFVGYEDGSVGVFSVSDATIDKELVCDREILKSEPITCPFEREPMSCFYHAPMFSKGLRSRNNIFLTHSLIISTARESSSSS
uniref:Uncharacterized protein n=1 Tax=Poecilia latipinna TaxID=48699 RepID=A0A3B3V233_9TELE